MNSLPMLTVLLLAQPFCPTRSQDLVLVKEAKNDEEASVEVDLSQSTDDVFVATHEWQEIKPGQAIPKGLHVRINMQTGKKEAKILTEEGSAEEREVVNARHEALKQALKNIRSDTRGGSDGAVPPAEQSDFRTYDELKRDFDELNIGVKTDYEIMKELFDKFGAAGTDEERAAVLEDFEYYLHQYDNAVDFVSMGGLKSIVVPSLNSTSVDVRKMACFMIGGATQSNPKLQIASYEAGLVNTLLRLVSLDPEPEVATKAFYGLSSVLRNFPEAQNGFLRQGGLEILSRMFRHEEKAYQRLQIKILTFLDDLLAERQNMFEDSNSAERRKQYGKVNLESKIKESNWCRVLQDFLMIPKQDRRSNREDMLSALNEDFPIRTEHDSVEKIIAAMVRMKSVCGAEFQTRLLQDKLDVLGSHYVALWERERAIGEDNEFFSRLVKMIDNLRAADARAQAEHRHTEL